MFGSIFFSVLGLRTLWRNSFRIHIYNGCGQTKTTRQASTLSKTAKKTKGQWHPSNLFVAGRSHSRTPKPHSQWLVDSFCIHWCTPSNIKMWYCESLQEPSVRGFSFHAVNLNYCGEAGDWGGVRWRRWPSTRSLARKCLRCISDSKQAASSSEMLTPQFHWTSWSKSVFFELTYDARSSFTESRLQ